MATASPLSGRTALVTGAGRGIGRATALLLAEAGATVVLAARTRPELEHVAGEIASRGGTAHVVPADLMDRDAVAALAAATRTAVGQLDVLIHNAGGGPPHEPFARMAASTWEGILRLNLRAPMLLTQLLLPDLLQSPHGALVFISSIAGTMGAAGAAAYSASKFAVRGFAQSLFEEVREQGLRVSVVCPGFVDTALIPPNRRIDRARMLRPEDVAEAVLFAVRSAPNAACAEILVRPQRTPYR